MFLSIKLIDMQNDWENHQYKIFYLLEDTEFVIKLASSIEKDRYDFRGKASIIPSGLICCYEEREKNVPKNLALFYANMLGHIPSSAVKEYMQIDRIWTDKNYPTLQYSEKYFKCVVNQLDVLYYTGKARNAKFIT